MALLTCNKVSVSYENHLAVKEVSFSIERGAFLCIVGENGSGKSTLLKAILKLIPIFKGEVHFEGITTAQIGYLPQQTVVQKDFPASVGEVVLSGCLSRRGWHPFYTRQDKTLATQKLKQLGLLGLKNASYRDLSGGQQQRVLLARALCATDQLIFLDEPVTGLDPVVTDEFYDILESLNRKEGITVVMVTHDIAASVRFATKILHLDTQQRFFGDVSDYLESEAYQRMVRGKSNG